MVLYAAASTAVISRIKPLLDEVLNGLMPFKLFATVIIAAYIVKGLGAYFSSYLMTDVGLRVVRDIRNQLFRHTLNQSAGFFSRRSVGGLMSRITNDVTHVQWAVSETLGDLLREGLTLIVLGVYLFYVDWQLALVAVLLGPLAVHPLVRFGKRIRSTTKRNQEELEHLTHVTAEAFAGHRIVKAFGAETHEENRFRKTAHQVYRTNLRVTRSLAVLPSIMELLGGIAVVFLIYYGRQQIIAGELTVGEFTTFVVAAFAMYTPVKKLSRVNANLQQAMAASDRIFQVLDTHSEVRERPDARPLRPLTHAIEFQHVAFAYEDRPNKFIL